MNETDLIREVDEELRREQIEKLWKQHSAKVYTGAAIIVLAVAGYKGWQAWRAWQADSAGSQFEAALALGRDGKSDEAVKTALEAVASGSTSAYKALASLRLAAMAASDGKPDDALARYEALSKDTSVDASLRAFAQLQAAQLRLDAADFTEMQNRLNDLAGPASAWRNPARELLGMAAYKAGKLNEADEYFAQILADKDGRGPIGQRAEMMRQLILAANAKPEAAAPAQKSDSGTTKTN